MRKWMIALAAALALGLTAFGVTTGSNGNAVAATATTHQHGMQHAMTEALPIPDSWTDEQVRAFIAESDAKIDAMAGRTVAHGETIWSEGMPFTKSPANMTLAQQKKKCTWCPVRRMCHVY
jgi:hypothetical protein